MFWSAPSRHYWFHKSRWAWICRLGLQTRSYIGGTIIREALKFPHPSSLKNAILHAAESRGQAIITGASVRNYFGVSARFASSCTDFVVADLSIGDLADRPQASGGFVICLAKTRKLGPSGRSVDQYPDGVSNGL